MVGNVSISQANDPVAFVSDDGGAQRCPAVSFASRLVPIVLTTQGKEGRVLEILCLCDVHSRPMECEETGSQKTGDAEQDSCGGEICTAVFLGTAFQIQLSGPK